MFFFHINEQNLFVQCTEFNKKEKANENWLNEHFHCIYARIFTLYTGKKENFCQILWNLVKLCYF